MDRRYLVIEKLDKEYVELYTKKGTSWKIGLTDRAMRKGLRMLVEEGVSAINAAAKRICGESCVLMQHNFGGWAPWNRRDTWMSENEALEAAARMGGWLKAACEFNILIKGLAAAQQGGGMGSPYMTLNLWKVYRRRSPGEVARRMRAIAEKAKVLLGNSTEKWPPKAITLKLAFGKMPVRKAAVVAAAATLGGTVTHDDLDYISKKGALEGTEVLKRSQSSLVESFKEKHDRYMEWRKVGWVPKDKEVYMGVGIDTISTLRGKGGWIRRAAWKFVKEGGHNQIALINLAAFLGDAKSLNGFLNRVKSADISVHDAGINLKGVYTIEQKEWFGRVTSGPLSVELINDAILVMDNWDWAIATGWDPEGKGSINSAKAILATRLYAGAKSIVFAKESAKCGVSASSYAGYESRWLKAQESKDQVVIPAPGGVKGITDGGLTLRMLDKADPIALYIGVYTGCCQYPGSAGETSAWYSVEACEAGVWAVSIGDTILAQSFVWRDGDKLILDNIEAIGHQAHYDAIANLYVQACKAVCGVFCIDSVWLGEHNDVELPTDESVIHRPIRNGNFYTDAHTARRVITG